MFIADQIIRRGTWLYDGSVPSSVVIARGDTWFGSGDDEDPPALRDDQPVETFRVWFESPPGSGNLSVGAGQFTSVDEAVEATAKLLPSPPRWE